MSESRALRGRVTYGSEAQPDAEVLALDAADQVVAAATTDADGSFGFGLPSDAKVTRLFARCRGPIAGVATCPVDGAASGELELRMDAHAAAWPLEIELTNDDHPQHEPVVRLMPLVIGDIAPETMHLVTARVGEVANSVLESRVMSGGVLHRRVLAGRWWFQVEIAEAWEGRPVEARESVSWVADGAWDEEGTPLQPLRGGYEVEVEGPTRVRVHLSPVPQASD